LFKPSVVSQREKATEASPANSQFRMICDENTVPPLASSTDIHQACSPGPKQERSSPQKKILAQGKKRSALSPLLLQDNKSHQAASPAKQCKVRIVDKSPSEQHHLAADVAAEPLEKLEALPQAQQEEPQVAFETLEGYKTSIDSTTELQASSDVQQAEGVQIVLEWPDPATGCMMGYELCDEHNQEMQALEMVFADESHRTSEGIAHWKDPATGVMMGYELCSNDGEMSEQDSEHEMCSQHDDQEDKEADGSEDDDLTDSPRSSSDGQVTPLPKDMEWIDTVTGAMLGYAVCDEDLEHDAMIAFGYGACDEASAQEASPQI